MEQFVVKKGYPRGVGKVKFPKCNPGEQLYGSICYPACQPGYENILSNICRKTGCGGLAGAVDQGVSCAKPGSYGRGTGYVSFEERKCKRDYGQNGCEWLGAMVYPKCKAGFYNVGHNVCSPKCPDGYGDSGANCFKPTYGRGAGVSRLVCAQGLQENAGLCYKPCPLNTYGVGPVCWSNCSAGTPVACGLFCTSSVFECTETTVKIVGNAVKIPLQALTGDVKGVIESFADGAVEILSPPDC